MASETTANLALPYLAAAQAQKHVTHNEALRQLDALVHLRLESVTTTAPPSAPAEGGRWHVPAGATGAFAGRAGMIAAYESGAWDFLPCAAGFLAYIVDERRLALFDGTGAWVSPLAASPHRGMVSARVLEQDVYLFGASVGTTIAIPNRAVVLGVSTRTLETISGASAYTCGTASEPSKFGGSLGVGAGNTNSGVIGPTAYYAETPILLSAMGGAFTGGMVRVAIHVLVCDVPTVEPVAPYAFMRPEAAAVVARMVSAPSTSRKWLADRLVDTLMSAGVWAKLDALYVLAAPDAQAARLNWISASYGLTEVNSPAFTANRGYTSDGATSYLRTGYIPGAGTMFQQNNASFGVYIGQNGRRGLAMGALSLPDYRGGHIARYAPEDGGYCACQLNETGITSVAHYTVFLDAGLVAASRADAASVVRYKDGVTVEVGARASQAPPNLEFYLLAVNVGSPLVNGTDRIAAAFMGGALTAVEMGALHAALQTYLAAVGA
ncbi:DUF2793 domain-containing protein [Azorhizobium sp. AG788]|uniref:DUF2793 domain-containing protein n=1 Tax=Azorhizobium sp. AG788 TaxID=2183897 RepID=UPI0031390FAA